MSAPIIYDSSHIRVMFHQGSSDYALITFNPATWVVDGARFWCEPIAQKAGITTIGIMTYRSNWYPAEDMKRAIEVINRHLVGYSEIIGYGSSMGGYGALKYGRLLHLTRVLAFTPQWSIAPLDVSAWDSRFVENYRPDLNAGMAIQAEDIVEGSFIFYDPFVKEDRLNVEKLVELYPAARLITSHLTGHAMVAIYAGTAKAQRLFDLCLADDLEGLRRQTAVYRRDPAKRFREQELMALYLRTKPEMGLLLLDRRPQAFGPAQRGSIDHQLAAYWVGKNDLEQAASYSAAAAAADPNNPEFKVRQSAVEVRRQNYAAGRVFAEEAIERWPKHRGANVEHFECLLGLGDLVEAERRLDIVSEFAADTPPVIIGRWKLAKAQGDQVAAIWWMRRLLEVSPTVDAHLRFAGYMSGIGKHRDSSEALRRLVEMVPGNAEFWLMLAGSYLREPRAIKAAEAAGEAAKLDPTDLRACRLAVSAYDRVGMGEFAMPYRKRIQAAEEGALVKERRPKPVRRQWWFERVPFIGGKRAAKG